MSNTIVPPPPYQSALSNSNGLISVEWSKWINQLYIRSGGSSSPDLSSITSNITTLQGNVATLNGQVTSLQTDVGYLQTGLGIGRAL